MSPLPIPVHAEPDHAGHRLAGVAAALVGGEREIGTQDGDAEWVGDGGDVPGCVAAVALAEAAAPGAGGHRVGRGGGCGEEGEEGEEGWGSELGEVHFERYCCRCGPGAVKRSSKDLVGCRGRSDASCLDDLVVCRALSSMLVRAVGCFRTRARGV